MAAVYRGSQSFGIPTVFSCRAWIPQLIFIFFIFFIEVDNQRAGAAWRRIHLIFERSCLELEV
jgi:hypothetical protein